MTGADREGNEPQLREHWPCKHLCPGCIVQTLPQYRQLSETHVIVAYVCRSFAWWDCFALYTEKVVQWLRKESFQRLPRSCPHRPCSLKLFPKPPMEDWSIWSEAGSHRRDSQPNFHFFNEDKDHLQHFKDNCWQCGRADSTKAPKEVRDRTKNILAHSSDGGV